MSKERAELLAQNDRYYYARHLQGEWCVWDAVSDHEVEFDFATEMEVVGAGLS